MCLAPTIFLTEDFVVNLTKAGGKSLYGWMNNDVRLRYVYRCVFSDLMILNLCLPCSAISNVSRSSWSFTILCIYWMLQYCSVVIMFF